MLYHEYSLKEGFLTEYFKQIPVENNKKNPWIIQIGGIIYLHLRV